MVYKHNDDYKLILAILEERETATQMAHELYFSKELLEQIESEYPQFNRNEIEDAFGKVWESFRNEVNEGKIKWENEQVVGMDESVQQYFIVNTILQIGQYRKDGTSKENQDDFNIIKGLRDGNSRTSNVVY